MRVKICGLRSRAEVAAAAEAGAFYIGMVFYPPSPRHLTIADARWLAEGVPDGVARVALVVDADDAALAELLDSVPIDMLQLHGRESPNRVAAIRSHFRLPVMKAVGVGGEQDLAALDDYARAADQLLVDARPPAGARLPGGSGRGFDWRLIAGRRWGGPWMLAGGLNPENVRDAVRLTGATQVDVSSGVERAPGVKDRERILAFVQAAQSALPLEA
jgi:phosphoribosylanthranilate isomerase